jgi:chaperonin GroES
VKRTTISPLYDRLLVRKVESADVTEGGIIIPESAKEPLNRGIIVAAGSGKMLEDGREIPLKVKVGDEIIFGRFAGTEVQIDGDKLVTMREDECFGVVKTYEVIEGGEMPNPRATDGPQNIGPPDIYSVSALAEPIPPGPFAQGE